MPGTGESFFEPTFNLINFEWYFSGIAQAKIMQINGRSAGGLHRVVEFFKHLDAHVLQHRKAQGERNGTSRVKNLESQRSGARWVTGVQIHGQFFLWSECFHDLGVSDGTGDRAILPVASRKSGFEAMKQAVAPFFAETGHQGIAQVILPPPYYLDDLLFDFSNVEVRYVARFGTNDNHHPCQG